MDLVDDLELLDDYDDLEFDRFGVAAGDTSTQNKNKYDTTSAAEYRDGKDMQGIPWERLHYSREDYRGKRLNGYRNYESLSRSHELLDSECKHVDKKRHIL